MYRLVREGFSLAQVRAMVASSPLYSAASVLDRILGSSDRRGQRQKKQARRVRLNARQSATAFQYAQALERAIAVFGNQQLAEQWLGRPCNYLAGKVPLDVIENWWGFKSVEDYLQKIELGIYC
ncbi:antitoxin Xre/MbcA/ParS toxin-binding domain-containing protein [Pseudomonas sp. NPDC089743]|uniref:antitoxin Xre/MbcA/ParS toxin-binding domain-containing protein n=1 Tax=Pseudomonas sp. NPDC089743 TaxID=3364471 RepID=UPI0038266EDC